MKNKINLAVERWGQRDVKIQSGTVAFRIKIVKILRAPYLK